MRQMGLEAVYRRRKHGLSISDRQHKIYPSLLRGVEITRSDQVWSAEITYIRMYISRMDISCGGDGLVQPVRAELGSIDNTRI
jgi:hypothetical protein